MLKIARFQANKGQILALKWFKSAVDEEEDDIEEDSEADLPFDNASAT